MTATDCPAAEDLAALVGGLLSGDDLDRVAAHLDSCSQCQAAAARVRGGDTNVAALCRELVPNLLTDEPRYVPVALHAAGGLGEVHVAEDTELGRRVALKRIREGRADDADSRRRFLREAEITARLEHPGVVPVYGLTRDADGRPHYAMRFVAGESLQQALCAFHDADKPGRDPGERRLALRGLLARFVTVCQTVAYAHSRGVVHRDLKPANVMLGPYGETLVVDWGLAKKLDSGQWPRVRTAEVSIASPSLATDSWPLTTAGAVGTPAYMSPEQAAGKNAEVGPTSDVFGLGAILYAILTGRAPREEGAIVPPRTVGRSVPAALEAICLKALAANPADRYESAAAVGEDVDRWLAGEPVRALPERWPARAVRWAKRHRVAVGGLAAGLLVAAVLGSGGGVWFARTAEERRAERGRLEAKDAVAVERALAEVPALVRAFRFRETATLLDQTAAGLSEPAPLHARGRLEQARADARLAEALDAVRLEMASVARGDWDPEGVGPPAYRAAFERHGLDCLTGDTEELARRIGTSPFRETILTALDHWVMDEPDAATRGRVTRLAKTADPDPTWRDRFRDAIAVRDKAAVQKLAAEANYTVVSPDVAGFLAHSLKREDEVRILRSVLVRHPDDFWLNYRLALSLFQSRDRLAAATSAGYMRVCLAARPDAAAIHASLGDCLRCQGNAAGAETAYHRAAELSPRYAAAHDGLGMIRYERRDFAGAEAAFRHALTLPARPKIHARSYVGLGLILEGRGDVAGAEDALRRALELDSKNPNVHGGLGKVHGRRGDLAAAEAAYTKALELDPGMTWARNGLGNVRRLRGDAAGALECFRQAAALDPLDATAFNNLGNLLRDRGDRAGAEAALRRAVHLDPRMVSALINLGNLLREQGDLAAAEPLLREAVSLAPDFGKAHLNLGLLLRDRGNATAAEAAFRRAVGGAPADAEAHACLGLALAARDDLAAAAEAHRKAVALVPRSAATHHDLADVLLMLGRFDEAVAVTKKALDLTPTGSPGRANAVAQLRRCERCAQLAGPLAAVLRGEPPTASDHIDLAELAALTRHCAAAVRLYEDLFRTSPKAADRHRAAAARAAARAGCGRCSDSPPDADRTRLRRQALDWLKVELARTGPPRRWQSDPDLAGVRDADALAKLPADERAAWTVFWADVAKRTAPK